MKGWSRIEKFSIGDHRSAGRDPPPYPNGFSVNRRMAAQSCAGGAAALRPRTASNVQDLARDKRGFIASEE